MDDYQFILGLANENEEALGFIPAAGIQEYVTNEEYILQHDSRGKPVGYLLHGIPTPGGVLTIAQHCIEYDLRQRGHGLDVVRQLIDRANQYQCRAISLKCAEDLPSNYFWLFAGFEHTAVLKRNNRRKRNLNRYLMDLWPTLFTWAK